MDPFDSPFGEIEQNDFSSWDLETDPLGLDVDTSNPGMMNSNAGQPQQQPSAIPANVTPVRQTTPAPATTAPASNNATPGSNPSSSDKARRITVWNRTTKRKVSGNAAPMEKNLSEYLRKHPDCELYTGQDRFLTTEEKQSLIAEQNRIPIWNKLEQRKISGNAAPSEKNLAEYLRNRPHCEVYAGQDKPPGTWTKPESTPARARAKAKASPPAQQSTPAPESSSKQSHTKTPELPIPKNTSLSEMFRTDQRSSDPYTGIGSDIPFKPDESEVFSMSGMADSLPSGLSLDDGFGPGMFMDMCGTSVPDGGMAVSPAQRILQDRAQQQQQQQQQHAQIGEKRARGMSMPGIGNSYQDVMGMSFSYRDLLGMSAGTPTPGALQQANDLIAHDL